MSRHGLPLSERLDLNSMPVTDCGCIVWLGALSKSGYGIIKVAGSPVKTHRVAYECAHGEIPENLHVLHSCDNRPCINPSHLFVGTNSDNVKDKVSKNRTPFGEKHWSSKLSSSQVLEIINSSLSDLEIAMKYGMSRGGICNIKNGSRRAKESLS